MPKLIDVCTVRTKDRSVEGNRKAVAETVLAAVKKQYKAR